MIEPANRFPAPLHGSLGAFDWGATLSPGMKLIGAMAGGALILYLFSKTKPGKKALSGVRRRRRSRRVFGLKLPRFLR